MGARKGRWIQKSNCRQEFTQAKNEVPVPPKIAGPVERERVRISEGAKNRFELLAAGQFLHSADRVALLKELAIVNSVLALPPGVDESLRSVLPERNATVRLGWQDLLRIHETILTVLNVREVSTEKLSRRS